MFQQKASLILKFSRSGAAWLGISTSHGWMVLHLPNPSASPAGLEQSCNTGSPQHRDWRRPRETQGHHRVEQGRMSPCWPREVQRGLREGGQPWHYHTALPAACSCTSHNSTHSVGAAFPVLSSLETGAAAALLGERQPCPGKEPSPSASQSLWDEHRAGRKSEMYNLPTHGLV